MPDLLESFAPLARDYDVLLCDVWGVVHNGVVAFAPACEALSRFRAGGGTVILITNAPRPGATVGRILDRLGVPREHVTHKHGDSAREIPGYASVGSRSAMTAGAAIVKCVDVMLEKGKRIAAMLLEASEDGVIGRRACG